VPGPPRRTRRGCPNRERRRTASWGDADAQPPLSPELWFRLVELLYARGELSFYARRMAMHLTHHTSKRGRIDDLEDKVIPGYKNRHGIGRRSAYTDIGRLAEAGLMRQVHAACPGRGVAYQMCVPHKLPADLPAELRTELRKRWARPSKTARAAAKRAPAAADAVRVALPLAEQHRVLAGCEGIRIGASSTRRRPATASFRGGLHTSPFLKRALPQPLHSRSRQGCGPPPDLPMGQAFSDQEGVIASVIDRCTALWRAQRPTGGLPDAKALARLRPLLWAALCAYTSSDVIEALTTHTRSARDLGAVAATRLRRMALAARRAAAIAVDNDGARHRALQDELARDRAAAMNASANARQAARQALNAIRDRRRDHPPRQPRLQPVPPPEPEPAPPTPGTAADVLDPADLQMLRQAIANATTGTPRRR